MMQKERRKPENKNKSGTVKSSIDDLRHRNHHLVELAELSSLLLERFFNLAEVKNEKEKEYVELIEKPSNNIVEVINEELIKIRINTETISRNINKIMDLMG